MKTYLVQAVLLTAALVLLAGCGPATNEPDGGDGRTDSGLDDCQVDNSQRRNTDDPDWLLAAGGEGSQGFICPRGDIDHYHFQIDQPRTIVEVILKNNVDVSPVDYCYDIFFQGEDARVSGKCDYEGMDGVTEVIGTHYLNDVGTYFLEVRDASADEADARYSYALSIDTVEDPDSYEPNNTPEEAKPVGADKGYISFLADEDWYSIQAQAGQILIVDLSTDGPGEVDLHYTLYMPDKMSVVNEGSDPNGMDGAASLHDVLPLNATGTFYLQINDVGTTENPDGDDSDMQVGYSLQLTVRENDDPRDSNPPFNNSFETATVVNSGQTITDGFVATRGDQDWYVIHAPGIDDFNPALVEIELQVNGQSPVDPAIDVIVADPRTECTPGAECRTLETWPCGGCWDSKDCQDAQCPSHECFTDLGFCRGADVCLPRISGGNGCGIRTLVMHGADWSTTGNPRQLHTIAPMYGDTYYVVVRSFNPQLHDADRAYQFTVTVHPELDAYEPNGLYLPYQTDEQGMFTTQWNRDLAKTVTCTEDADSITCGPITGYLSYRGDQDWYRLVLDGQNYTFPKLDESDPETMGANVDWDIVWEYQNQTSMSIGFVSPFGQRMGPEVQPGSGSWGAGSGQCSYYCGEYHTPAGMYMWVFNPPALKKFDHANPYIVTVKGYKRCAANCGYCSADCTAWCCPNPNNPNPSTDE